MTAAAPARSQPGVGGSIMRVISRRALPAFTVLALGYLLIPIAVMIVFSFNLPEGKFNFAWNQFSLDAWFHPFDWPGLGDALRLSLEIAFISTVVATILGTLIGLAITRYQFRGRGAMNGLIFLPMATPEIVMGSSLLTLFVSSALPGGPLNGVLPKGLVFPLGFNTIVIAHVMFNISYGVVTVKPRLGGFDRRLEEAAMDLGANELVTFWKITFPLIFPGIMAAALLAFSLSIDDFVITNFTAGQTVTLPMYIYGAYRVGVPVQVNVIGTIIFLTAVGAVVLSTVLQRRDRA